MLHRPQRIVGANRDTDRVSQPSHEPSAVILRLASFTRIEPPNACARCQLGARIRRTLRIATAYSADVPRRAYVHIQRSIPSYRECLGSVSPSGQSRNDRIRRAGRNDLAGPQWETEYGARVLNVQVIVEENDFAGSEPSHHIELRISPAVTIRIAQENHTSGRDGATTPSTTSHEAHVYVAVRRYTQMPRRRQAICEHRCAEAGGEVDASIVRCALHLLSLERVR